MGVVGAEFTELNFGEGGVVEINVAGDVHDRLVVDVEVVVVAADVLVTDVSAGVVYWVGERGVGLIVELAALG